MRTIWLSITILILGLGISGQKADLIPGDAVFTPDTKIEYTKDFLEPEWRKNTRDIFVPLKYATGTINGVAFKFYYSDSSGSIDGQKGNGLDGAGQNWSVGCKKDPIDDTKQCRMSIYDLSITVHSDGSPVVYIGASHDPGSNVVIRIDGEKAISIPEGTQFLGRNAPQIIERLSTAKQVTTRYSKWPREGYQDKTFELYGFNEAYAYINWALKQIK